MSTPDAVLRSDALLEAIYASATEPSTWVSLHQQLLKNFRYEERPTAYQHRFVDLVLVHIQRALKIAETRERMQWERRQIADFIDSVAPAICVIRADRTLVGLNPAAKHILRAEVGMSLNAACFMVDQVRDVDEPHPNDALERALHAASEQGHGAATFRMNAAEDEIFLHVGKLSSTPEALFSVVIFRQDETLRRAIADYAEQFRLTPKERRVVEQAVRCASVDDVATAEQIGYHTARQHLRAVYEKTGVSNQAELVSGILRQSLVQEAARTQNAALLPHVRGLAHSRFLRVRRSGQIRELCYAEYGDPAGTPVLFFHSVVGSRLELFSQDEQLRANHIRLIVADRPGYGHTDFYEYTSYRECARDICQLLDALGLERIGILAYSAGTAPALACAELLGARVSQVHCASSMAPFEHVSSSRSRALPQKFQARMFRIVPALVRPALELMLRGQTVESLFRSMVRDQNYMAAHPRDAQFISQPEQIESFVAFTIESLRQGPKAWAKEAAMVHHDWGVSFRDIQCPVHFWHGDADDLVPTDIIRSFAREFTQGRVTLLEGETHLLVFRHLPRILQAFHQETTPAAPSSARVRPQAMR
jgi:pimeloyl-ACP methyl ester carboxylesterase/DNA-binding CsgD family transcriptional regulator